MELQFALVDAPEATSGQSFATGLGSPPSSLSRPTADRIRNPGQPYQLPTIPINQSIINHQRKHCIEMIYTI